MLFLDAYSKMVPEHYPLFLTALRTGMRLGEILGLQWGDIDFNSKYILVKRSYKRGQFSAPKNQKGRRVDMSDQLVHVLKGLQRKEKEVLPQNLWVIFQLSIATEEVA